MAIKDQCAKCKFFSGDHCSNTTARYVFDHSSCDYYVKTDVSLDKKEDLPNGGSSQSYHSSSINLDKKEEVVNVIPEKPIPTPSITVNPPNTPHPSDDTRHVVAKQKIFAHPFSFQGRIRRTELILSWLAGFPYGFLMGLSLAMIGIYSDGTKWLVMIPWYWFIIAQQCKRFHDRGESGWHIFYYFIPIYNLWVLIQQFFFDGDEFENEYGPDPRGRNIYA